VNDESDCDIGLGALFYEAPEEAAMLKACLRDHLSSVLKKSFIVNDHPQLQGRWGNGRMTLTQQSVAEGMLSVQLELSLSLRKELNRNRELRQDFARALYMAFTLCLTERPVKAKAGVLRGRAQNCSIHGTIGRIERNSESNENTLITT